MNWLTPKESWMTIDNNGSKLWKNKRGQYHRKGKPAIMHSDGSKEWWINGNLHHEGGPAIEEVYGCTEWYLNGIRYSENQWKEKLDEIHNPDYSWFDGIIDLDLVKKMMVINDLVET